MNERLRGWRRGDGGRSGWLGGSRGVWGLMALVLGVVSALALLGGQAAAGLDGDDGAGGGGAADPALTVRLIVDFNDGSQRVYSRLAWSKGMTVLDVLERAKAHRRGIDFSFNGRGETVFVTSIDGLANERGGRESKNWLYWVNTSFATRSAGVTLVEPGDVVLWKYERWDVARGE